MGFIAIINMLYDKFTLTEIIEMILSNHMSLFMQH